MASRTASSSLVKLHTESTGPKISSLQTVMDGVTSASTVGAMK